LTNVGRSSVLDLIPLLVMHDCFAQVPNGPEDRLVSSGGGRPLATLIRAVSRSPWDRGIDWTGTLFFPLSPPPLPYLVLLIRLASPVPPFPGSGLFFFRFPPSMLASSRSLSPVDPGTHPFCIAASGWSPSFFLRARPAYVLLWTSCSSFLRIAAVLPGNVLRKR